MSDSDLPPKLQEVVDLFRGTPKEERLQLLLEYSESLPDPPSRVQENPDLLEQVPECQTPFFLATDVEDGRVALHFLAPEQAPTVRGYAGILHEGLSGSTLDDVLGVPDMFYLDMGLSDLISPLRLRGMGAILARLKNHVQQAA
ncbi:MAG TPA: SufE family protein [Candidatus Binatia bacterium]|nr:SufE family protein [Candidatus Binatia bacterium]